jgi:lipopolysaccharide export LptBFGC system permease protein LptF
VTPPGYWLRAIATRLCEPQTVERLVDPIVADLQMEDAALGEKNAWRRRRLRLSTYVAFWKALGLHVVLSVAQPASDGARLRRAVGVSLLVLALFTAALTMPPLLNEAALSGDWGARALLVLLLMPQALAVSIPAAACVGILYAMRARPATRRDLYGVLMFTVLASTVVWAVIEWGVPGANQAFRELVQAQLTGRRVHLEPGLNELGFTALGQRTDLAAVRHYHLLWALSFAPIPLGVFVLSVAPRVRGALPAAALAVTVPFFYYSALWTSEWYLTEGVASPILAAWAPNALFLAAALGLRPRWRREAAL